MQAKSVPDHILFVAAWYPDAERPFYGAFIKEHAIAVSHYAQVSILHIEVEKSRLKSRIEIDEEQINDSCTVFRVKAFTPVRRFGVHDKKVKQAARLALSKIIAQRGDYSIVHYHVRNHIAAIVSELPELKGRPSLLTEHWSFYHTGIYQLAEDEQQRKRDEIKRWLARPEMHFVCPVSKELAGHLTTGFGAREDQIRVVPNVANALFQPYPERRRANDKIKLVLAASWTPPKNPMLFASALEKLTDNERNTFDIEWIGGGSLLPKVEAFVKAKGWTNIKFHGFKAKEDVAAALQKADWLVHPSNAENLPSIIIEALSCGVPILSHAINGIPELVDDSNGILCPAKDVNAFADALRKLTIPTTEWREAIAQSAAQRFSPKAVGQQYYSLYEEALK